jgi:hypothetical protein
VPQNSIFDFYIIGLSGGTKLPLLVISAKTKIHCFQALLDGGSRLAWRV